MSAEIVGRHHVAHDTVDRHIHVTGQSRIQPFYGKAAGSTVNVGVNSHVVISGYALKHRLHRRHQQLEVGNAYAGQRTQLQRHLGV